MRPILLKMTGFGPYASTEVVDFRELGDNGLFVITGDTGAGKTTIFDAMTYALFGEASGESRDDPKGFRSKYASADTKTEVEFTFSVRGIEYNIKRNPEYERPKSRGDGVTKQVAGVELSGPDGLLLTKNGEVLAKVEEIVGVNADQYKKIAMIAQGDFLKLLLASTEQRIEIFRKLFDTSGYKSLQEKIKADYNVLSAEYKASTSSIDQYISEIVVLDEDVLCADVALAKSGKMDISQELELLDRLIDSDDNRKNEAEREAKQINDKRIDLEKELKSQQDKNQLREQLIEARSQYEAANSSISTAKNRLDEAKSKSEDIIRFGNEAVKLEESLKDYDELEETVAKKKACESSLNDLSKELESCQSKLESMNKQLKVDSEKRESLKGYDAKLVKIEAEISSLENEDEALKDLINKYKLCSQARDKASQSLDEYIAAKKQSEEDEAVYVIMNRSFLDAQAGLLAANLVEGSPCPVCGSVHHPSPAVLAQEAPTEEALKKAEEKAKKSQDITNNASVLSGNAKTTYENYFSELKIFAGNVLGLDDIQDLEIIKSKGNEAFAEIKAKKEQAISRMNEAKANLIEYESLEKAILLLSDEINTLGETITGCKEKKAANESELTSLSNRQKALVDKLKYNSKDEVITAINSLRNEARTYQDEIESATKSYEEIQNRISNLSGSITSLAEAVGDTPIVDLSEQESQLKETITRYDVISALINSAFSRKEKNEQIKKNILEKSQQLEHAGDKLKWMKSLSDTANGEISGKSKVKLETYIQSVYFDKIINKANARFMQMTNNQYMLKRREEASNNKSQTGLDLDVIDITNNTSRPVNSLSGGESFVASLSLALGLSDEIQSSAGGIQLDSMFIDEGFGTLDPEILQQTMRALLSLTDGNRLVGIISHREELKSQIDKQIIVTKDIHVGSHVRIVAE